MSLSKASPLTPSAQTFKTVINVALYLAVAVFAFAVLQVNPFQVLTAGPGLMAWTMTNFFPLELNHLGVFMSAAFDTLLFAVVGTYVSAVLSFILGICLSESLMPNPVIRGLFRFWVSFLRNIPVLVWTSILVFVFGIGNLVGLIALVLATVGFLARSYAESMNAIADTKLEAMRASGASWLQVIVHGLMPEFAPEWLNWTLFSFEINLRASAILGVVGAGGIGILIQSHLNLRNFGQAGTLIVLLVAMVLASELSVNLLRKRLN